MAAFLVTYHGGRSPTNPQAMEQIKAAFGVWPQASGSAVVDPGAPVRKGGRVSHGNPAEAEIGGYTIVEAATLDEATTILQSHPFVARGGALQSNQVLKV